MTFNTIKKVLLFAALTVCPLFGHSQVTTGWHRVAQVVARGSSGTQAVVVPNANIYVTGTGSGTVATIYSDPLLSIPIPTGMVTSDSSGNYSYYMPLGYCVNERASYPGSGNFTTYNICTLSGGGVTQIIAGTGISISPSGGTGAVTINSTGGCVMQGASGTFNVSDGTGGCLSIPADFGATWPDSYTLNTVGTSTGNGAADFNLNLSQTATSRNSAGVYIDLEDHGANIYGAQYNFLSNSDGVNGAFYLIDLTAGVGAGAGTWELDTSTGNALPSHNAASNSANMAANLVAGGGTNAATFSNSGNFQLSTTCDNLGTHCGDAEFDLGGEGTTAENFIVTTQANSHADSGNFKVDTLSTTGGGGQAEFDLSSTGAGFNITAPSFSMTLPSDTIAKINSEIICTASNGACSSGGAATYITVDGTGTPPTNYQALTAGANITLTPNAGAHTMTIASTGGGSSSTLNPNPATTAYVFYNDSRFIVVDDATYCQSDGFNSSLQSYLPAITSATVSGGVATFTYTAPAAAPITGNILYLNGFTGTLSALNGQVVTVSGTGSGTFTATVTGVSNGSYTDSGTAPCAYNAPRHFQQSPLIAGHGKVVNASIGGGTTATMDSNFATLVAGAPAVTAAISAGSPIYLYLMAATNDFNTGTCPVTSTLEGHMTSIMTKFHALAANAKVILLGPPPAVLGTGSPGCGTAVTLFRQMNQDLRQLYAQNPTNQSAGTYYDDYIDMTGLYQSMSSSMVGPGGIHWNKAGGTYMGQAAAVEAGIYQNKMDPTPSAYVYNYADLSSNNTFNSGNATTETLQGSNNSGVGWYLQDLGSDPSITQLGIYHHITFLTNSSGGVVSFQGGGNTGTKYGVFPGSGGMLGFLNGTAFNATVDTALSRDSAGVMDLGNGTAGDKSGSLNLTNLTVTGTCTGCGGGSGFPITLGSTSIAASSTTTSISGLTLPSPTLSGTPDASGATQFKLPVGASFTSAAQGEQGYDSTNLNWHVWQNSADNFMAVFPVASPPTSGNCAEFTKVSNSWKLIDAGGPCGVSGGGVTAFSGDGALLNNSSSVGSVTATLANAAAFKWWGNPTSSSATPAYSYLPINVQFVVNTGVAASPAAVYLTAPNTGTITACTFTTTTSDGSTDLSMNVKLAGTSIFSGSSQTITHGTSGQTQTALTLTGTINVTAGNIWEFDISAGTSVWTGSLLCH